MTESSLTARIGQLPCFVGELRCEPLSGGITNRNFRVADARGDFVVRFCENLEHLGIHRPNEALCQRAAAECGVAPEVVYQAEGILVSRFVPAPSCSAASLRSPAVLHRAASTLRRLHGARDRLTGEMLYFCPFQTLRTYAATARLLGAELPSDLGEGLADARRLQAGMRPFAPALCHNDLLAANLLDDGQRIWLIDWEYAGVGNPLFDLASIAANAGLNSEQQQALLEAYFGSTDAETLRALQVLQTISLFREALWAFIQTVKSSIDFDYRGYAADQLAAYRRAREELR